MAEYTVLNIIPDKPEDYVKFKATTNIATVDLLLSYVEELIKRINDFITPDLCAGIISIINSKRKEYKLGGFIKEFDKTVGVEAKGMVQFVQNILTSEQMRGAVYRMLLQMYRTADVINMSQPLLNDSPMHLLNIYEPQLSTLLNDDDMYALDILYYTVISLTSKNIMVLGEEKHTWRFTINEFANMLCDYWYYAASSAIMAVPTNAVDNFFVSRDCSVTKYYAAMTNSTGMPVTHATYIFACIFDSIIDERIKVEEKLKKFVSWIASHTEGMDARTEYGIVMHTLMSEIMKTKDLIPAMGYATKQLGPGASHSMYSAGDTIEMVDAITNQRQKYVFGTDGRFHLNSVQGQIAGANSNALKTINNKYNNSSTPLTKWRRSAGDPNVYTNEPKPQPKTSSSGDGMSGSSSSNLKKQLQIEHDKNYKLPAKRVTPGDLAKDFQVRGALTNNIKKSAPTPSFKQRFGKIGWIGLIADIIGTGYYIYNLLSGPSKPPMFTWGEHIFQQRKSTANMALMGVSNICLSIVQRNYIGMKVNASNTYTYQSQALEFLKNRNGVILVADGKMLMDVIQSDWYKEEIGKDMFIVNFLHMNLLEVCTDSVKQKWTLSLEKNFLDTSAAQIPAYTEDSIWYAVLDQCLTEFVGVKALLNGNLLAAVDVAEGVINTISSVLNQTVNNQIIE